MTGPDAGVGDFSRSDMGKRILLASSHTTQSAGRIPRKSVPINRKAQNGSQASYLGNQVQILTLFTKHPNHI